jgi:hypothetical protein
VLQMYTSEQIFGPTELTVGFVLNSAGVGPLARALPDFAFPLSYQEARIERCLKAKSIALQSTEKEKDHASHANCNRADRGRRPPLVGEFLHTHGRKY